MTDRIFAVERRVALACIRAADKGHDPLRLGALHCEFGQDTQAIVERRLTGVDAAMAADTAFEIDNHLDDAATRIIGGSVPKPVPVDVVTAGLLAHAGVDPLAAVWLLLQCGKLEIDDLRTGYRLADLHGSFGPADPANGSEVLMGRTVWRQRGVVIAPAIPETMLALVEGRPLREVVSHPVLDRYPLLVVKAEQRERVVHIHTDHRPVPAPIDELVAAMPRV